MRVWCNLKDEFNQHYGTRCTGMRGMLGRLRITLDGQHHLGMDDGEMARPVLLHFA